MSSVMTTVLYLHTNTKGNDIICQANILKVPLLLMLVIFILTHLLKPGNNSYLYGILTYMGS